jgi:two-component system, NarL family, nitrate/nitrite response regulator NarL
MFKPELIPAETSSRRTKLSRRETQVVELATLGHTNPEIAGLLELSTSAVKFHLASVYRKLGVSNRTEAAVAFVSRNPGRRS